MSIFDMPDQSQLAPFYDATALLADANALQQRMDSDGYLFFKGLLPAAPLLELRDRITAILADRKWIAAGDDRLQAKVKSLPHREGEPEYLATLKEVVKLESLHSLAHRSELMSVMQSLLGEGAFPHPLSITRLVFPQAPEISTPPHQDYPNNQGTEKLTAAWVPLSDCPREQGSLAILEGSHKFGLLPLQFHLGPGNRAAVLDERFEQCRWLGADFELGDVVLFPALTVHRALDNSSSDALRLSVDFRYQPSGAALTPGCLKTHFDLLPWDDIYSHWHSDDLKYYWQSKQFEVVPWQAQLHSIPDTHIPEAIRQQNAYKSAVTQRYAKYLDKD